MALLRAGPAALRIRLVWYIGAGVMARRRFFVPEVRNGTAELTGPQAEHLVRVLRAERGQVYELSDNRNLYLAEIASLRKSAVSFRVLETLEPPRPSLRLSLLAALIKSDRFEWLIEKATELGVSTVQPFEAARTERGLLQASASRLARWERIALEASQQARRVRLPTIKPAIDFAEALNVEENVRLLLDEDQQAAPILDVVPQERNATDRVAILLGPEGGWTDAEREHAIERGWGACSLGETVLRAETAGVAALAVLQAAWKHRE